MNIDQLLSVSHNTNLVGDSVKIEVSNGNLKIKFTKVGLEYTCYLREISNMYDFLHSISHKFRIDEVIVNERKANYSDYKGFGVTLKVEKLTVTEPLSTADTFECKNFYNEKGKKISKVEVEIDDEKSELSLPSRISTVKFIDHDAFTRCSIKITYMG